MEIQDGQNRKVRLLVEVENLDYTAAVFFADIKSSLNYHEDFNAMAVVSDKNWLDKDTDIFGKLLSGLSAKRFEFNEYEKTLNWLRQQ